MVLGAGLCVLIAGVLLAMVAAHLGGRLAGRLGLRRWEVHAPYVIVDGEPLRLGARVTFGAARRLARAQRGSRIYDRRRDRWAIEGRRWSERANGYLGERVDAGLAARLLGVEEAAVEELLRDCGLEPEEHAGREGWPVADVLGVAVSARLRSSRKAEPAL